MSDLLKLKDYEGQPFVTLKVVESARQEQVADNSLSGVCEYDVINHPNPTTTKDFYQVYGDVHTGVIGGTNQDEFTILPVTERYWWDGLGECIGPEKVLPKFKARFQLLQDRLSELDVVKEGKDGSLLIWNGNFPALYEYNLEERYQENPDEMPMPSVLSLRGQKSRAIIVGAQAIEELFGLGDNTLVRFTEDIYHSLLRQGFTEQYELFMEEEEMEKDNRRASWRASEQTSAVIRKWKMYWDKVDELPAGSDDLQSFRETIGRDDKVVIGKLEAEVNKIPLQFFKEGIFSRYDIPKPKEYAVSRAA